MIRCARERINFLFLNFIFYYSRISIIRTSIIRTLLNSILSIISITSRHCGITTSCFFPISKALFQKYLLFTALGHDIFFRVLFSTCKAGDWVFSNVVVKKRIFIKPFMLTRPCSNRKSKTAFRTNKPLELLAHVAW